VRDTEAVSMETFS